MNRGSRRLPGRSSAFGFGAMLLGALTWARPSLACKYGPPEAHVVEPEQTAVDSTPPSEIGDPSFTVRRGHALERSGCSETNDSCADTGIIGVHFEPAADDRTDGSLMGYRVRVVAGELPSDEPWPEWPVRATSAEALYFGWTDGETDDQEEIDATLSITAIDRAGNEGPPTELRIRDPGSSAGCRVSRARLDLSWALTAGALWWLGSRAARSRRPGAAGRAPLTSAPCGDRRRAGWSRR